MTSRINARIDDELAARIEALSKRTGKSTSAIVKAALDAYYAQVQVSGQNSKLALQAAGFIGCAEGDCDLSSGYKDKLTRRWDKKT